MNKCLVTKLSGSSNNPELLRLGEMRMKILKVPNPTEHTQGFSIWVNKPVTLEIVSDGYFTDKTLTENKGKNITLDNEGNSIWVNSNSDVEIAILDKYSLISISSSYLNETSGTYGNNIKLSISDFKYSKALVDLYLSNTQVTGDIANLKSLTSLKNLNLSNTQVTGDIVNLKSLTSLKGLNLSNTQVTGDIVNLKSLTALTFINLSNRQSPITGDISELSVLVKCDSISIDRSKLTGDLATLPSVCRFVSFSEDKGSVFTWSTRPSSSKIIAIGGNAYLTNIDKMLQDQAQCNADSSPNLPSYFKTISVRGSRTSASDDAVQTLQQKGYTVVIIS